MADYDLDPRVCGIKGCDRPTVALGLCVNHWRRNRLYGSPLARKKHSGMFIGLSAEKRFDLQTKRDEGCWIWTSSRDKDGYGIFRGEFDGEIYRKAHRYSYAKHTGEHPGPLQVLHSCDNPSCVNPDHLTLGTNAENMADKIAKGRARVAKGEDSGHAKITEVQAIAILGDPRPYQQIAQEYGLTRTGVSDIKNRKSWRHLDTEIVKGGYRGSGMRGKSKLLTEQDVRDIRASAERGKALAARYGVSPQSICDIQKRRSWRHIE